MEENRTDLFGGSVFDNTPEKSEQAQSPLAAQEQPATDLQDAQTVEAVKTQEIPAAENEKIPAQTAQQKVNAFYGTAAQNENGCTYAYGRTQQPNTAASAPQSSFSQQTPNAQPSSYAQPPVRPNVSSYAQPSAYSQPRPTCTAPNAGSAPQSYYGAPQPKTDASAQRVTAEKEDKKAKKKEKKEKKQKSRMSFGQIFLCLVLCLVVGSVSGYVSSKTAVQKTLDAFMETLTTDGTTGSYNINIYEQQSESASQTVQSQEQTDDATVPVVSNASASDIYKQNVNAVVNITAKGYRTVNYGFFFGSQQQEFTSSGSGFFLTEDGYILTNYHVVEDATTLVATDYEGNEYTAKLVGYEESNDIAVLKVSGTFQAVELGDSRTLEVGDTLLIIGNALGELQYTLTQGVVSYLERAVTTETGSVINMFQTDAAINSGNSGGPVFNAKGEVVGIASAKYASSTIEGLGFCIPIDDVKYMISDIVNVGYVTGKPSVGVSLYTNASRSNGLPYGCYIVAVQADSAADNVGLSEGDVITAVDGQSVREVDDFGIALNGKKAGDTVTLTVYFADTGRSSDVTLTLDEYVPAEARTEYSNVYDY